MINTKNLFITIALLGGIITPVSAVKKNSHSEECEEKKDQTGSAFAHLTVAGLTGALSYVLYQEAQNQHQGVNGFMSKITAHVIDFKNDNGQANQERAVRIAGCYAGSIVSGAFSFSNLITGLRKLFR